MTEFQVRLASLWPIYIGILVLLGVLIAFNPTAANGKRAWVWATGFMVLGLLAYGAARVTQDRISNSYPVFLAYYSTEEPRGPFEVLRTAVGSHPIHDAETQYFHAPPLRNAECTGGGIIDISHQDITSAPAETGVWLPPGNYGFRTTTKEGMICEWLEIPKNGPLSEKYVIYMRGKHEPVACQPASNSLCAPQ